MGYAKGSTQAMEHMAKLRSMRGKNKSNQSNQLTINNAPQPVQRKETEAPTRRGRLVKGSEEARIYMASIRPKR